MQHVSSILFCSVYGIFFLFWRRAISVSYESLLWKIQHTSPMPPLKWLSQFRPLQFFCIFDNAPNHIKYSNHNCNSSIPIYSTLYTMELRQNNSLSYVTNRGPAFRLCECGVTLPWRHVDSRQRQGSHLPPRGQKAAFQSSTNLIKWF